MCVPVEAKTFPPTHLAEFNLHGYDIIPEVPWQQCGISIDMKTDADY